MRQHIVNRPDEAAMQRILEREELCPEGTVIRLAWQQGLTREEIADLRWEWVSFLDDRLELPDRMVPLESGVRAYLWRLFQAQSDKSSFVVLSTRIPRPMQPESISRLARQALDREGQTQVRLMDLRHDWIIRQLAEKDWPAVARVSGVEIPALQARFAPYAPEREKRSAQPVQVDEFKLWKVLQAEQGTPAGLALWLAWQLGLQGQEMVNLTWDQVDLDHDCLRLGDRELPLTNAIRRQLEAAWREAPEGESHVLLTEHSRRPIDLPRLSRMTRAVLIRGGMEQVQLRHLRRDEARGDEDSRILALAGAKRPLSRGDVMETLGLSKTAAYARLHRLTEQNKLVRVGGKYYLPGTVVPPARQLDEIRAYLAQAGFAYRQDIADLLHIERKQCAHLLRRLVQEGRLVQSGQRYYLPQAESPQAEQA